MTEQVPTLRVDVEVIPADYQGKKGIVIKDPLGLIKEPVFLHGQILDFMGLIDGRKNKRDIQYEIMRRRGGLLVSMDEIDSILQKLDNMFLLDSPRLRRARQVIIEQYNTLTLRESVLAGHSYPADKEELKNYLDTFFQPGEQTETEPAKENIHALISPHIEIEAGRKVYSAAFRTIKHLSPKRIILVGTGHAMRNGFISLTGKDFSTPLGIVRTDREFIAALREKGNAVASPHDMAHRSEHSLEIQLIFLQYLFGSEFTLVPILFGSFESQLGQVSRLAEIPGMAGFLDALKQYFSDHSGETLIAAGVDLSHIGPKFAHHETAFALLPAAQQHDRQVIEAVCAGDVEKLWQIVAAVRDRFNICGFSTLACLLEILPPSKGIPLGYDIYREAETDSAVSFAAIAMTASPENE